LLARGKFFVDEKKRRGRLVIRKKYRHQEIGEKASCRGDNTKKVVREICGASKRKKDGGTFGWKRHIRLGVRGLTKELKAQAPSNVEKKKKKPMGLQGQLGARPKIGGIDGYINQGETTHNTQ